MVLREVHIRFFLLALSLTLEIETLLLPCYWFSSG